MGVHGNAHRGVMNVGMTYCVSYMVRMCIHICARCAVHEQVWRGWGM